MYTAAFGLRENPFAITPDPRYLFMSERHREALAHLLYGATEGGGFVQITGEVGTGKTTVTRVFLEQLPQEVDAALILNPKLSAEELLETILEELHIEVPAQPTPKRMVKVLNDRLLESYARGRRTVVVIDEAQNLGTEVLEQVRLLTNLETDRHKLLQIFLVGQPELRALLGREEMRQLAQRITARYHLDPLNEGETAAYIHHRLQVAGGSPGLFPPSSIRLVYLASGGIPRLINVICDRALLGTYAVGRHQVSPATIRMAVREVAGEGHQPVSRGRWRVAVPAAAIGALLATAGFLGRTYLDSPEPPPAIVAENAVKTVDQKPEPPPLPPPLPLAGRAVAEARLLGLWELAAPGGEEACVRAQAQGMRCYAGRVGLKQLRLLNRPAVVKLAERGREGYAVVTGLGEERAQLDFGGETRDLPLARLESALTGEILLLWRPPVEPKALRPGARGEPVAWLREALGRVDGHAPLPEAEPLLDKALEERIRAFQRQRGLHVDGVAGEQTVLHLWAATNAAPGPVLGGL